MRAMFLAIAFSLTGVTASFADGLGDRCTPVGTWYGGAEGSAKWLLTVVPTRPGHYSMVFDEGFTPAIAKLSPFSGELVRLSDGRYKGNAIALANTSATPPPLGGPNPAIWAIREFGALTDCDTLEFVIDFYGIYNWGRTPFLDPPDGSRLPPEGFVKEVYVRMPRRCLACTP
jgi:hypothetical protein